MRLTQDEMDRCRDYAYLFNTEQGMRVLDDLRRFCNCHRSSFTGDALSTAFGEGKREVVLRIERLLKLVKEGELDKPGAEQHFDPITNGDDYNG